MTSMTLPYHQVYELEAEVVEYLLIYGRKPWTRIDELSTAAAAVYETTATPGIRIPLPFWRGFQDYGERMAKALVVLATVEDRTPWEVLTDARAPNRVFACYKSMTLQFRRDVNDSSVREDARLLHAFRIHHFERFAARCFTAAPAYASQLLAEMPKHKDDLVKAGLHGYANNTESRGQVG